MRGSAIIPLDFLKKEKKEKEMNQTEGRCLMIMTLIASWLFNLI